ncbi:RusA family crossover junction endodeoxyribonuclease [Paraburkholderia kururiensis]|uniref:RusA family crossover junction endodeoxyribonuclease n=1 Tax=Paraburkholderia kururiensis TaxID=984307 RepID=UPI00147036C3|nr:RusA family crossover junction endodeoxyribonuclease [Paraburkholderia kururiensis]
MHFVIPFAAVGKGRPRFYRGTVSTPTKTRAYERSVALIARAAMRGRVPFSGPIRISIDIDVEIPRSWPKYRRIAALDGKIHPTVRPDLDNCTKAIADAMNAIVYADDVQIVQSEQTKRYASDAAVRVTVEQIEGERA